MRDNNHFIIARNIYTTLKSMLDNGEKGTPEYNDWVVELRNAQNAMSPSEMVLWTEFLTSL